MRENCWRPPASNRLRARKRFRLKVSSRWLERSIKLTREIFKFGEQTARRLDKSGADPPLGALGGKNMPKIAKRPVEIAVDEYIIIFRPMRNFLGGVAQAPADDV